MFTGKKLGYRNHEHLQTLLRKHSIRRLFKDIFGHQEIVQQIEWLDMNPEQRRLYDKFEKDAILELETFFITGQQPGTAFIRARQIMEHPNEFPNLIGVGTVDIMPDEATAKFDRLDLHLTDYLENQTPVIIYASLVPQQLAIVKQAQRMRLRVGFVGATGDRYAADEGFRSGALNCLVGSPLVADAGFNWQFCGDQEVEHIIFASLPYVDVTYTQALRRAIRKARSRALRVTVLAYRDSIDLRVMQLMQTKSADANLVDPTQMRLTFL